MTTPADPSEEPSKFPRELGGLLAIAWDQAAVGLCLSNAAANIVAANRAFAAALGYAPGELKDLSLLRLLSAEAAVAGTAAHEALIAGRPPDPDAAPMPMVRKDRRPLFAHVSDARLVAPDGRVFRLTTLVDLEREAEAQPRLQQMQRAEGMVALAGAVSNDFNNLLSIILGYTSFLQDSSLDRRRLQMAIDGIQGAVHRSADLIKQTLYLTRRDAPMLQHASLPSMLEDLARRLTADETMKGLIVEVAVEPGLTTASLDVAQICHALWELVRKVWEVLGHDCRVRLSARAAAGAAVAQRFPDACEPDYLSIEARFAPEDGGGGLPVAASPLGRFVERRNDLVFLVTQTIVAAHRGVFATELTSDGAALFQFYLPLVEELERPTPEARQAAESRGDSRTVLLVDDEESLQHAMGYALERLGCTVLKARDGIEAVDTFKRHADRIALVICDLGLPRMSGWEAFMKMKEIQPNVRVLVMSGHLEPTLQAEMERAGAVGFLQKPFPIGAAFAQVRALLGLEPDQPAEKR